MKCLTSVLFLFLYSNLVHSSNNEDLECDMGLTSINRYWTTKHLLKPNGCVNRTNISLIYMDGGTVEHPFFNMMRDGPRRICIDYDIHCMESVYGDGDYAVAGVLPRIATDVAGSTNHGYGDLFGISLSGLHYTGLDDVHDQGVVTSTHLNGGMYNDSYNPIGTLLHVAADDYLGGYNACKKMIRKYGVTNILVILPFDKWMFKTRRLACLDAMMDNGFSNDSLSWMPVERIDIEADIETVANNLLNNSNIDGIFACEIQSHDPAFYLLNRALNGGNESLYGFTKSRAKSIKCLAQIDFSATTIDGFRTNITKFASTQQPYIMTSYAMLQLAIYASTGNQILFNHTLLSGPHFIETVEDAVVLECTAESIRYCHDEEPDNPFNNCSCINTQNTNKTMYLFHYGADSNSDYYTYFKILENGALQAASDHNITLNVISSDNITTFKNTIKSTINTEFTDNYNNDIKSGILSPLPNIGTTNVFKNYLQKSSKNTLLGIGIGFEHYKSLNIEQGNFFGADDIASGYKMSQKLHEINIGLASIICIDNRMKLYASINDRCSGVENYCYLHNLSYELVDDINNFDIQSVSPIAIVSPGYSTCIETQDFIKEQREINSSNVYIAGCFDSSSNHSLNGLVNEDIQIIMDNQPWLIGYISVVSLFHKLFLSRNLASNLIQTGPKIITVINYNDIQIKVCENVNYGFDFCPLEPEPGLIIDINYPTLSNFSGIFILILFIFSLIIVICLFIVLYKYRQHKVIKKSQPFLLLFTIIGAIIMMSSGLIFVFGAASGSITSSSNLLNNSACNVPLSIWCVGFTLFFVSYTFRVWKYVKAIEAGLSLSRNIITTRGILMRLSVFVIVDILLVINASIFTPFTTSIHYELLTDTTAYTIASSCTFNNAYIWYIVFIYKFILLIWVLMVAFRKQASNNKLKKLQYIALTEGPNITAGIYVVIISFLLFIVIAVSLENNNNGIFAESTKWVLIISLSFICFVTTLFCIIMSKLMYIFKQNKLNKITIQLAASQSRSNSANSNSPDLSSKTSNDELYFNSQLQRCEYLINETLELVESNGFSVEAAKALLPKIRNCQSKIRNKSMMKTDSAKNTIELSLDDISSKTTGTTSTISNTNDIQLTSQNKTNNDNI